MMIPGRAWTRLVLLAACAFTAQASAQDILINPSGTLLSDAFGSSAAHSTDLSHEADLNTVQYGGDPSGQAYCPPSFQGGPDGMVYERPIPNQRMLFSGNPKDRQFYSYEGLFFRVEYLNWDFKRPGDTMMGESTLVSKDITVPFLLDGFVDPSLATGYGKVSTLEPIALNNTNGVRGTLGIPLTFGSFEASALGFHIAEETFNAGAITGTYQNPFRLNSFTVGGETTDLFRVYSSDYQVNYTSKLYGAETNLFFDGMGGQYLTYKPMAGFRFLNLTEEMEETGTFESIAISPFQTDIRSNALNNLYIPQVGVRLQFESKWFTFAFDPKIGLGLNDYYNKVSSNDLTPGEGYLESKDSSRNLMQMVDLGMTGRVPVSEYFSITLGYNFMWLGRVSRASQNVAYDVNPDLSNNIHVDTQLTDMVFQGASIGGEFIFR